MSLLGHIAELRTRLIWSFVVFVVASIFVFPFTDFIMSLMRAPLDALTLQRGRAAGSALSSLVSINFSNVSGAFDLRIKIAAAGGLVLSSPFWLWQLWMFFAPGLKRREKLFVGACVLTCVPLFILGTLLGLAILPRIVLVLASFAPVEDSVFLDAGIYYLFILNLCVIAGFSFLLPAVLVFLNFGNVITAKGVLRLWRLAVIFACFIGAVATPAADVLSMVLLALPLILLYFLAFFICFLREKLAALKRPR